MTRIPDAPDETYHENSKYHRRTLPLTLANLVAHEAMQETLPFPVRPSKAYPGSDVVKLPRPHALRRSLRHVLTQRTSRPPSDGDITLRALASLLWAAQGRINDRRTAPSAGALYPLEVYVRSTSVRGLAPGWYHFDPYREVLERLRGGGDGPATWTIDPALGQGAAHVVVSADLPRLRAKYGPRAYRFAILEAGHAVQNLLLASAALRLAAVPVGGFFDDEVHDEAGLDGVEEVALYVVPVGPRAPSS